MRELTEQEVDCVGGGNLILFAAAAFTAYNAWGSGKSIASDLDSFNREHFGMTFGDAIYKTFN